jgi:hypothetical protein
VIARGTVLGGRYQVEEPRSSEDGVSSWWALDQQLHRRVVVVLPGGGAPLDVARTARLDYAGRLLDGGEHDGEAYLVIRAEGAAAAAAGPPPAMPPRPPVTRPTNRGDGAGAATGDALPVSPADPDLTTVGAQPRGHPPVPPEDRDDTVMLSKLPPPPAGVALFAMDPDSTDVQPLPARSRPRPPVAPVTPLRPSATTNTAVIRSVAVGAVAFLVGASGFVTVAMLATPDEPARPAPPGTSSSQVQNVAPTNTLPSDPGPASTSAPTVPETSTTVEQTTTTTSPTTTVVQPTTTAAPAPPPPPTTRRRRGRAFAEQGVPGG